MAGKITTNSVVLGDSITDTQNFVLKTNADGTATLARGALGGLGTVFGVNGSGALTGATLVAPALGTPASGVLTNCTGVAKAALPAGSVLQVVFTTDTATLATTSTSFVASGTSGSITPSSATSKILVIISGLLDNNAAGRNIDFTIFRNSTNLGGANGLGRNSGTSSRILTPATMVFLDSPSTTSSVTYSCYIMSSGGQVEWNGSTKTNTVTLMEIAG